jgi:two-component system sensor histidine kinase CpxA
MRLRSSLYSKLLLWLLLDLLLIGGLFFAIAGRSGVGWSMLLSQPVRERLLSIGERIGKELSLTPEAGWDQLLASYSGEYGVDFSIEPTRPVNVFVSRFGGPPPGGDHHGPATASGAPPADAVPPPDGTPPDGAPPPPPGGPGPAPPEAAKPGAAPPQNQVFRFNGGGPPLFGMAGPGPQGMPDRRMRVNLIAIDHAHSFDAYELRIPSTLERSNQPVRPLMLHARAAGLVPLLRFLGVTEWLSFALLVVLLSALLWTPFIWGITSTVVRLTRATAAIADGRFETRVQSSRRDELGRLAESVNRMAERLRSYVAGQKQFLADVAHEVTSPLARLQMGLGILESRLGESEQRTLHNVQDAAQQMSRLLDELLLFSRADMQAERIERSALRLEPLLREALRREDPQHRVRLETAEGLRVLAQDALLERAVANLVRNALRYGGSGPVELRAAAVEDAVRIVVGDRGPGVPAAALARLGEPFFRPAAARDRDSGGTGLGLAIVRRCVASCGGSVAFRNREGGGFEAEIRLDAA